MHDLSTSRVVGQTAFDHQFASKGDGSFNLINVPAGKYEICVEAPHENVLDPCVWSPSPKTVTVSGSAPVTGVEVKVETGYRLQVRVNDAQALLPPPSGGIAGDALSLMVVGSRNRYLNFRLLARDNAGRDHYLLVPFNEPLTVVASSTEFALSDGGGKRLANDSERILVVVPPGKSYPPITLNVGKK